MLTYHLFTELFRAGFTKQELRPIGCWKHDGKWQAYNRYWDCCYELDPKSKYCAN